MKLIGSLTLLIVCSHLAVAQSPPAVAAGRATKALTWPPPHMGHLPPDYLLRLRESLDAGTNRLGKLRFDRSVPSDTIGWVRYGMPALILGQRVDEINRYFESDKFEWPANPKFGFSLFSVSCMRLYGAMNHRTGPIKGPLSQKSQENFERGMWRVAKANSKLSEAKRGVREMEGSENHHLSSKTCDLLAAQFLRNIPAYANQKYDDGSTLAEQYEVRRDYFSRWFDDRARRGQFVEAGSPSYQSDSIAALFNLRDFAEDPVLRQKAEMFLDLAYAVMAEETLLTTRGGPKSRVKVGHEYDGGFADRGYNILFNAPGRTYTALGLAGLATSDYYPPPAIVKLAKDTAGRGEYAFTKRWPGPIADGGAKSTDDPDGVLWRTLDAERSVLRKGFATRSYVLGSAGLDPTWLDDASMGFRWQGVVFDGNLLSRIGFEVKPNNTKDWHGFNPFFTVQDRNVMVTQKWAPVPTNPRSSDPARLQVYFSSSLDEVLEEGGWIFARDGGAFAAVKVVRGGSHWTTPWKHSDLFDKANKAFLTLESDSPVILLANQASDYGNDFGAFRAAVRAEPIREAKDRLDFATITFFGPSKQGLVEGKVVDVAPPRGYDSPFIRSDWNSGLIFIRKGADTVLLDFRDPAKPVKTVAARITDAFPPGEGRERPIILGQSSR